MMLISNQETNKSDLVSGDRQAVVTLCQAGTSLKSQKVFDRCMMFRT